MNQSHVLDIGAEVLIGRIFLKGEAKFTAEDMEVAGILLTQVCRSSSKCPGFP